MLECQQACRIECQLAGTSRLGRTHTRAHTNLDANRVENMPSCTRRERRGGINNMQTSGPPWVVDTWAMETQLVSLSINPRTTDTHTHAHTHTWYYTTAGFKGWAEVRQRWNSPGVWYQKQMVTELGSGGGLVPEWYMDSLCYYFILDSGTIRLGVRVALFTPVLQLFASVSLGPSLLCLDCMRRVIQVHLLVQNVFFSFLFLQLNVWAPLCKMILVLQGCSKPVHFGGVGGYNTELWHHKYLEAGPGPIFSVRQRDVEIWSRWCSKKLCCGVRDI